MHIKEFKPGDTITRIAPTPHIGDRSYMAERVTFIGYENNIVVFKYDLFGESVVKTLPDDEWGDGWNYYPEDLVNKAKTEKSIGNIIIPLGWAGEPEPEIED